LGDGIYNKRSRDPGNALRVFSDYCFHTIAPYSSREDSEKEKRGVRSEGKTGLKIDRHPGVGTAVALI